MGLVILEEKAKTTRERYEEHVKRVCEQLSLKKLGPLDCVTGQVRIARSLKLLEEHIDYKGAAIADLGSGFSPIALILADQGALLTALDASEKALLYKPHPHIAYKRACIPYLPFADAAFDGLIFTDVIAEIEPHLYRLTLSELSRLLKQNGWMLCSTELDLYSHDAYEKFIQLLACEFELVAEIKSYHRLHFYLSRWIQAPSRFVRAARDANYRSEQLQKRLKLMRIWFYLHSAKPIVFFWKPIAFILRPLQQAVQKSRKLLLFAEKLSKMLWGSSALTHVIVLVRKKKI